MPTWIDPPSTIDLQSDADRLAAQLGLHPLAAQILVRRGYHDLDTARAFLDPDAYQPAPPEALPGLAAAVARLQQALDHAETILVWGDFDVDGQTAAAVLVGVLRESGGQVRYHIPVRAVESHGVGLPVLRKLLDETPAPQVLLTCDTGIADVEPLAFARDAGLAVIVTDHHALPADGLPPAQAVVTPRLLPAGHPLSGLPGVGVAYKLVEALCTQRGQLELAAAQLDLVALGIVADVALQTGDTRYLLQRGLRQLNQSLRPGLQAVFIQAGLQPGRLDEDDIGFVLAPRLNALGRLSDANPAVELLTTTDTGRARLLAVQLEGLNTRRQLLTSQTLSGALSMITREPQVLESPVLVLSNPAWEPGVTGIVASRLVEMYARPVVLFATPPSTPGSPDRPARGSARSVEGVNITAAIAAAIAAATAAAVEGLVTGYGGHPMAAGLSLPAENIPEFTRRLAQAVQREMQNALLPSQGAGPALEIDACLPWDVLDRRLAEALRRLAPFGPGNPAPVLASRDLRLLSRSVVGRSQQHLALIVADAAGMARRVMWWGGAELAHAGSTGEVDGDEGRSAGTAMISLPAAVPPQAAIDLAYRLHPAEPGDATGLQLEFVDIHLHPTISAAPTGPELVDLRRAGLPAAALHAWLLQAGCLPAAGSDLPAGGVDWQVWAEADAFQKLAAVLAGWYALPAASTHPAFSGRLRLRGQLSPCHILVIWTIPPGRAELLAALERTRPQRVVLVGVRPPFDTPQPFLERLAGLVKFALGAEHGMLDLERLAGALAQRTQTVRRGLAWLAARGDITLQEPETAGVTTPTIPVKVVPGGQADTVLAAAALQDLRLLLQETQAYRSHFERVENINI